MKLAHLLTAASLTLAGIACTTPAPNPPGIEEQPKQDPTRNPAHMPTSSMPAPSDAVHDDPAAPTQDTDSMGTVRTPQYVDDSQPQGGTQPDVNAR
jgi:hypothetical protein